MPQLSRKIKQSLIPIERIEHAILLIRGVKVILDTNLAILYEVETRVLTQAVKPFGDPSSKSWGMIDNFFITLGSLRLDAERQA